MVPGVILCNLWYFSSIQVTETKSKVLLFASVWAVLVLRWHNSVIFLSHILNATEFSEISKYSLSPCFLAKQTKKCFEMWSAACDCFKISLDVYVKHSFFLLEDVNAGLSLNAIWNEKEYSLTSYLQCRNCVIQSISACPLIGAEVTHFNNKVQSQVSKLGYYVYWNDCWIICIQIPFLQMVEWFFFPSLVVYAFI